VCVCVCVCVCVFARGYRCVPHRITATNRQKLLRRYKTKAVKREHKTNASKTHEEKEKVSTNKRAHDTCLGQKVKPPLNEIVDTSKHRPPTLEVHVRHVCVSRIHGDNLTEEPVLVWLWRLVPARESWSHTSRVRLVVLRGLVVGSVARWSAYHHKEWDVALRCCVFHKLECSVRQSIGEIIECVVVPVLLFHAVVRDRVSIVPRVVCI
jgi:hypothetical protein